jgi:hypothetical protein
MRTNPTRSIVLIQNPLCGNQSIIEALGLSEAPCPDFSKPREARAAITPDEWKNAKKIVLARSVASRFESAATYAANNPDKFEGDTKTFFASLASIEGAKAKGEAILKWLVNIPDLERPVIFQQQRNWLASKFDLVLCTDDIAMYFNGDKDRRVSVARRNVISRNPRYSHVAAPQGKDAKLLDATFPDDTAILKRVVVWNPKPDTVRLVTGQCDACAKKQKGADSDAQGDSESASVELLDLTKDQPDEAPVQKKKGQPKEEPK